MHGRYEQNQLKSLRLMYTVEVLATLIDQLDGQSGHPAKHDSLHRSIFFTHTKQNNPLNSICMDHWCLVSGFVWWLYQAVTLYRIISASCWSYTCALLHTSIISISWTNACHTNTLIHTCIISIWYKMHAIQTLTHWHYFYPVKNANYTHTYTHVCM